MNIKTTSVLLICTLYNLSCGMLQDKNLAKRYRNKTNDIFKLASDPQSFVQVDFNTVIIKEAAAQQVNYNVLSLTDQGQAAFLNSLNNRVANTKDFQELINSNFSFQKENKINVKVIPKVIKKSIVLTIDRRQYLYINSSPPAKPRGIFNLLGDRISYLELVIKINNSSPGIFNSWDKYVTDHLSLNLGKVSSAQNWNASLNLNAKTAAEASLTGSNSTENFDSDKNSGTATLVNTGAANSGNGSNSFELINTDKTNTGRSNSLKTTADLGGTASVGYTDKYETSLDLTSRILKLSGSLSENKIVLRQEGGVGIDLSGNIVVSIEYALLDDWATPVSFCKFKNLYTNGTPTAEASLSRVDLTVVFPDLKNDIIGNMDYSFLYRQVRKGNRHIPEARHRVKYMHGGVSSADNKLLQYGIITLIKAEDVRPKAYQISDGTHELSIAGTVLSFETIADAANCLRYLKDLADNTPGFVSTIFEMNSTLISANNLESFKIITQQL